MSRDNTNDAIKIIEFNMDDPLQPASESSASDVNPASMKIMEFDTDRHGDRQNAAHGKTPGRIKIIEFDDGNEERQSTDAMPKIKIMEFD